MAHITRKELKRDEFASEVSKTYEFVQQQREKLIRYGTAAAVLLVILFGAYFFIDYRRTRAAEELSHAMRVYYAPTLTEASVTEPDMRFPDDKAKYTQAEKEFSAVAGKYSWLGPGRIAQYFLGLTKKQLGKTEEAIAELRAVGAKGDAKLSGLAKFALAETYAQTGRMAEAEKVFRELADKPGETVSRDNALLALAAHLGSSKPAEAEKIYGEIKKQYADRPAAQEAERRLSELKKK